MPEISILYNYSLSYKERNKIPHDIHSIRTQNVLKTTDSGSSYIHDCTRTSESNSLEWGLYIGSGMNSVNLSPIPRFSMLCYAQKNMNTEKL